MLAGVLLLCLVLALAGCGKEGNKFKMPRIILITKG